MFEWLYPLDPHQGSAMILLRSLKPFRNAPVVYSNFLIVFHETEYSKTQSLFKNGHE